MAHLKTKIGEYAIIINPKNEFLMLQFNNGKWHFPGGRLDEGEKPAEGLKREIKEETGLEVESLGPAYVNMLSTQEGEFYGVFFKAKTKDKSEVKITNEHKDWKWFSKEDLGEIDFWQNFYKEMVEEILE